MRTPVLIIGSGLAGLITAYRLAQRGVDCVVATKGSDVIQGTNSSYAQGGIIYRSAKDSADALIKDILAAGDQINAIPAVEQLAGEGVDLVKSVLIDDVQVPFDQRDGALHFTREAAHSAERIIYVKDHTGKAIMEALWEAVQRHDKIQIMTGCVLVDLLTSGHNCRGYEFKYQPNRCLGAYLFDIVSGEVKKVLADYTVLCTGGIGQVYQYHTNAEHAYGSGLAVANRARVRIINSRFIQFHPTALWTDKPGRRFLISEALRGEGARLLNLKGEYLMDEYPQKDLESRAVVSRVIMEDLQQSGVDHVLLNLVDYYQGSVPIPERFPSIYQHCLEAGIDISKEAIPVIPAEHFFCGGIAVDVHGRSELTGLYAAGEVACTGVHGANRLASTSLLECLTWGVKAAEDMALRVHGGELAPAKAFDLVDDWESFGTEVAAVEQIEREKDLIRRLMWEQVGILRTKEKLFNARDQLRAIWRKIDQQYASHALSEPLIELRHLMETAHIITVSASSHTSLKEDNLGGHVLQG